jgi:uncharacterized protein (TIGR00661 family)
MGQRLCQIASTVSAEFIAYGCDGVAAPNIRYKNTSSDAFINDLAACRGVLSTAGQQLIGEARYFGKPILVVPMPGQHEQEINARFARIEGIGNYSPINHLTSALIEQTFDRPSAVQRPGNGVDQLLDLLGIGHG